MRDGETVHGEWYELPSMAYMLWPLPDDGVPKLKSEPPASVPVQEGVDAVTDTPGAFKTLTAGKIRKVTVLHLAG